MSLKEVMDKLNSLEQKIDRLLKDNTIMYLENQSLKDRLNDLLLNDNNTITEAKKQ